MSDSSILVAQLEHAALIGGFERTLLRDAAARIAKLEAERDHLAVEAGNMAERIAELEHEEAAWRAAAIEQQRLRKLAEAERDKLEAETHRVWEALDRCPLEFGRIIVKYTHIDPDNTWRAIIDPILYPPAEDIAAMSNNDAAVRAAVLAEREACAAVAEHEAEINHAEGRYIAGIIRARPAP